MRSERVEQGCLSGIACGDHLRIDLSRYLDRNRADGTGAAQDHDPLSGSEVSDVVEGLGAGQGGQWNGCRLDVGEMARFA